MRLAFALLVVLGLQGAEPAPGPRWVTDLEEGRLEAEKSGKPLFIVFT